MLFWTHILFSVTVYQFYVFHVYPYQYSIPQLLCFLVGTIFPDIDHPKSKLGRRVPYLSIPINFLFEHRGIVHSIVGLVGLSFLVFLLLSLFPIDAHIFTVWFALGFLLHLIEDGITKEGVFLVPSLLHLKGKMKTGGFIEKIVLGLLLLTNAIMLAVYSGFW